MLHDAEGELNRAELGELPEVKTAATLFQMLCYNNKDNLLAGIICAGWDKFNGGSVYNIPLGGALVRQPFSIGGISPLSYLLEMRIH